MDCAACGSSGVAERPDRTARGCRRFRCRDCDKQYNERSGTLLNHTRYPSDVIALVVLWRLRYRLTLRDLAEMFLLRGIVFSYEAVRDWETKLAPVLTDALRQRRHGRRAPHATTGTWTRPTSGSAAAGATCTARSTGPVIWSTPCSASTATWRRSGVLPLGQAATGVTPERITTDGHGSYPRAIRTMLGRRAEHRTSAYKNNGLEQDHRGIKGRIRCMRGFKSLRSADRFCRAYDELRSLLGPRTRYNQPVSASRVACFTTAVQPLHSPSSSQHRPIQPAAPGRQVRRER
jgi:transposase-like protein